MCVYECVMQAHIYYICCKIWNSVYRTDVSQWEGTMEKVGKFFLSNITF